MLLSDNSNTGGKCHPSLDDQFSWFSFGVGSLMLPRTCHGSILSLSLSIKVRESSLVTAYVLHLFHLGLDTLPRPFPILDFIKRLRAFFGVSFWAFQRLHVGPREADGVLQQEWP